MWPWPLMVGNVGPLLRKVRKFHYLSITEVAAKTGLSQSYLSEVERGKKQPTLASLAAYCKVLDIRVSELIAAVEALEGQTESMAALGPKMLQTVQFLQFLKKEHQNE